MKTVIIIIVIIASAIIAQAQKQTQQANPQIILCDSQKEIFYQLYVTDTLGKQIAIGEPVEGTGNLPPEAPKQIFFIIIFFLICLFLIVVSRSFQNIIDGTPNYRERCEKVEGITEEKELTEEESKEIASAVCCLCGGPLEDTLGKEKVKLTCSHCNSVYHRYKEDGPFYLQPEKS